MRSTSSCPRATVNPRRPLAASLGGERVGDPPERDLDLLLGVADELHEVHADGGLAVVVVGEEVADVLPDDVVLGQRQHLGIDGLDRGGAEPDQGLGVAQRGVEAVVAHVDQRGVARDRQHVELGFGQEPERALGAAEDRVEIEAAAPVADMGEVVAGQAAVELREVPGDQVRLVACDGREQPVDGADPVGAPLDRGQLLIRERLRAPDRAVEQDGGQLEDVVARLAVEARALAAGVRADHPADGGAVGGRELRREEQAVLGEGGVELVLDHAGFDPRPALRDVDLEDPVHVPRDVDHEPVRERLAVGPGPAAARGELHVGEARVLRRARDADQVVRVARERDRLRRELVDRVVGGQHRPVGMGEGQVAREAARPQLGQECCVQRQRGRRVRQARNHLFPSGWSASGLLKRRSRTASWPFQSRATRESGNSVRCRPRPAR